MLGKPCGNEDIKADRLVIRILARQNGQRASPLAHEQDYAFNDNQGDAKPNQTVDLIGYARIADIKNSRDHDKPDHGVSQLDGKEPSFIRRMFQLRTFLSAQNKI